MIIFRCFVFFVGLSNVVSQVIPTLSIPTESIPRLIPPRTASNYAYISDDENKLMAYGVGPLDTRMFSATIVGEKPSQSFPKYLMPKGKIHCIMRETKPLIKTWKERYLFNQVIKRGKDGNALVEIADICSKHIPMPRKYTKNWQRKRLDATGRACLTFTEKVINVLESGKCLNEIATENILSVNRKYKLSDVSMDDYDLDAVLDDVSVDAAVQDLTVFIGGRRSLAVMLDTNGTSHNNVGDKKYGEGSGAQEILERWSAPMYVNSSSSSTEKGVDQHNNHVIVQGSQQQQRRLQDPYSTKIDVCLQTLVDILIPVSEYNCWPATVRVCVFVCVRVPNPACLLAPPCCIPGVCHITPPCGWVRTVWKLITSAGDVHCFKGVTAGDIWNRIKERTVAVTANLLTGGALTVVGEVIKLEIAFFYDGADRLPNDVKNLLGQIRAVDSTPFPQSWDTSFLDDIRITFETKNPFQDIWLSPGAAAICLGLVIICRDHHHERLMNPPRNLDGGPVTLDDIRRGNLDDSVRGPYYSSISLLLHELIHTGQYTEQGFNTFLINYIWQWVINGFQYNNGDIYEAEANNYEDNIIPYEICGDYCEWKTGNRFRCYRACPRPLGVGCQVFDNPRRTNPYGYIKDIYADTTDYVQTNGEQFCEEEGYPNMNTHALKCGEDESSFVTWNGNDWIPRSSGSTNRCYGLFRSITCCF